MKELFFLLVLVTYFHVRECSLGEPIPELKIINGQLSGGLQHLFFAYITFANKKPNCGGAIIKENLILTAAHCFVTRKALQVYVGIHHVNQMVDTKPYVVKKKIPHPKYHKRNEDVYDIGLALLAEDILLRDNIEVIPLASISPPIGAQVETMGFGKVQCDYGDYGCENEQSDSLRFAFVKVINIDDTGVIYTEGVNQNTCYGDSGGPIVYYEKVVGVVSTGQNENCTGFDIQAPVALHYSWIQKYMDA